MQYFHHKIKLNIRKKPVPNFQDTKFVSHKQEWKWRNDAMTIKKKRTKIILPSILTVSLTCGLLLTGCQKTPDQSAVVSKAGGLSEDVIAEPLKDGETQISRSCENSTNFFTYKFSYIGVRSSVA